ncbi:MAG: PP2C family protein-serine/threonine phosphatase [Planctomycetota bacterium]|jgi:serine phosphatase RsbU (regulator of sigma subunit)
MSEDGREDPEILRLREENRALRARVAELERLAAESAAESAPDLRERQSLEFAHQLQRSFLPLTAPEISGLALAAHYRPAQHVSGDFYDFLDLPDGRLGLLVGDVAGKGIPAALYMARFTSHFRALALSGMSPSEAMSAANAEATERPRRGMFVTAAYAVIQPGSGGIRLTNAGHPVPLIRSAGGDVRGLAEAIDIPLGIAPDTVYPEAGIRLQHGETLVMLTDGAFEAKRADGTLYGLDRLTEVIGRKPGDPGVLVDRLLADVIDFMGDSGRPDDLTVVAVRRDR